MENKSKQDEEKIKGEKQEDKEEGKEEKVAEQLKTEGKEADKKQRTKKEGEKERKVRKIETVAKGKNLPISTKQAVAICKFIKGKTTEEAMLLLQDVIRGKRAVPMKGELPHRKGKIMSGRYPIKAAQQFIKLLKQLAANATINEIDLEDGKIECKADKASRPYRRFGDKRFKRSHVMLKLKIKEEKGNKDEEEKIEENKKQGE